VLCGQKTETTKPTEQINAIYSNLYGNCLTPVFAPVVVANLVEQQWNQSPGSGLGFQGQPKAVV